MNLSDSPGRPASPSRASGWSSLTTPWGLPCCVRFPCVHAVATTPAQRLGALLRSFTQPYRPETGQHIDRGNRNELVELARCRRRAWRRAPAVEEARGRRERIAEASQSLA